MRLSPRIVARIGICVQFAALIRCLSEYFRLRWVLGPSLTLGRVEPFVLGALVASVGALIAVLFYFWEKYLLVVATSAVTVAVLLVLRFTLL